MSMDGVNSNTPAKNPYVTDPSLTAAAGAPVDPQATATAAAEIAPILGRIADNLKVRTNGVQGAQTGGTSDVSVPDLDDADLDKALMADLEALVAYLQADMDEEQMKVMQNRLNSLKDQYKAAHEDQKGKIEKSIEEARKQERMAKANRILSWIGAIFAVAAAVVVSVATGGLAAGLAIAGAVVGLAALILDESGAAEKLTKKLSEHLQKTCGLSKRDADSWAQGIYAGIFMVLSLSFCIGGMGAASSAAKAAGDAAVKTAQLSQTAINATKAVQISGIVFNAITLGTNTAGGVINYYADSAAADVTDAQAILTQLQKLLEESEDDLKEILSLLLNAFSQILSLLESKTDVLNEINTQIGAQA